MKSIVFCGEALIDLLSIGQMQYAASPGGAPANAAVAAAKAGANVYFFGKVGKDAFGEAIRLKLQACGVRTDYLLETDRAHTALAVVTLQDDGERQFRFYRERTADLLITPDAIPHGIFDNTFAFHFGSLSLTDEPARTTTLEAARAAMLKGCLISFDPNVRLDLWPTPDTARSRIAEALPLADIVKVSEEELHFLTPGLSHKPVSLAYKAEAFRERHGIPCLLVTLGPGGCLTVTSRGVERFSAIPVKAVDTTGAGDAFVGALLGQLASRIENRKQWGAWIASTPEWPRLVTVSCAFASISTERHGAIDSYPEMSEVLDRLRDGNDF